MNGLIRGRPVRLDSCLRMRVEMLNRRGIVTLASCCGHGRYPRSILVRTRSGKIRVLGTGIFVPRIRRFYVKDEDGFFFIPELSREKKEE